MMIRQKIFFAALIGLMPISVFALTQRISVDSSGIEGNDNTSSIAGVTPDGRYVLFSSNATNLVADDTNWETDVFVRDAFSGTTERVNVNSSGEQAIYQGSPVAITPDGRYVLFNSPADNLVSGDTNSQWDAFVRDRVAGITSIVSVGDDGVSMCPDGDCLSNGYSEGLAITPDGRYVVFNSAGDNISSGDTNGQYDVFVRDMVAGVTQRASSNNSWGSGDDYSEAYQYSITPDGRYVLFHSTSTDLVVNDTNSLQDVFVKDMVSGVTTLVSVDSSGNISDNSSWGNTITPDGRYVLFRSYGSNLVPNDFNGNVDVFVRDMQSNTTILISASMSGATANMGSSVDGPAMTPDGKYVVFYGDSDDIVAGDTNNVEDVFVRNILSGTTALASSDSFGNIANNTTYPNSLTTISDDGRYVLLQSDASNLIASDSNWQRDAFIKDMISGEMLAVSVSSDGTLSNQYSQPAAITPDGRYVVFGSYGNNLIQDDFNGAYDVFVNEWSIVLPRVPIVDNIGSYMNTGSFIVNGEGIIDAMVYMTLSGQVYTGLVDQDGVREIPLVGLSDGPYTMYVNQVLSGGAVSATGSRQFTIDTIAPTAPTILTPSVGQVITGIAVVTTGLADPNSLVRVVLGATSMDVWSDGSGQRSASFVLLQNYQYAVSVTQFDAASNESQSASVTFSLSNVLGTGNSGQYLPDLSITKIGYSDNNDDGFDLDDSMTTTSTGKNIRYTLSYNNRGNGVASGMYIYETIPPFTCFTVGSIQIAGATLKIEYSNNNGATYNYIPTGDEDEQDCSVTNIRFKAITPMAATRSYISSFNGFSWFYDHTLSNGTDVVINTATQYLQSYLNDHANIFGGLTIDYNKDNCDDIVALGYATGSTLYTNDCSGGLTPTDLLPSRGFDGGIKADFNNDGRDDIIGVGRVSPSRYYTNLSGAGFSSGLDIGNYGSIGGSAADFNNDGYIDVMLNGRQGRNDALLFNTGGTGFVLSQRRDYRQSINGGSADFNKDGWMDSIAVTRGYPYVRRYENTGTGALFIKDETLGSGMWSWAANNSVPSAGALVGDFNNDTRQDFIVLGRNGESYLFVNTTTGGFTRMSISDGGYGYYRGIVYDVNSDGRLDLVATSYYSSTAAIYLNNKDNTFTFDFFYTHGVGYNYGADVSVGDFNLDNNLDYVFYGRNTYSNIAYSYTYKTGTYTATVAAAGNITTWDKLYVDQAVTSGANDISYDIYSYNGACDYQSPLLTGLYADAFGTIDISTIGSGNAILCVRAALSIYSGLESPTLYSFVATWNTLDTPYISFDVKVAESTAGLKEIKNNVLIVSSSSEINLQNNQDDFILALPPVSQGNNGFGGGEGGGGSSAGGGAIAPVTSPLPPVVSVPPTKTVDATDKSPQEIADIIKDIGTEKPEVGAPAPVSVDTSSPAQAIQSAVAETRNIGVGSTVEIKTIKNPSLQSEKKCYSPKEVVDITLGKNTTNKDQLVYQALLKSYDLTMFTDTDTYKPNNRLKRYEAAKMFTNFAKHVLCREAKTSYNNEYKDIATTDETLRPYIIQAYEYGILKGSNGLFRPLDTISRKEFVAALMRMFTNENLDVYGVGNDWDKEYQILFNELGLDEIVGADEEIDRYDMSKIMYKLYYNTSYQWTDKGYVLPYGSD